MKLTANILKEIVRQINHDYILPCYEITVKDLVEIIEDAQDVDD